MKPVLKPEVQKYIHANLKTDLHALLLKKSPFPEVSMAEIAQQIKGKNVAEKKFPFLLKEGIVFPPNLNLEQASSQATATFKSQNFAGKTWLDLTCGFGIDSYFFSKNFSQATLIDQDPELLQMVQHNWKILNRDAAFIHANLEEFLRTNQEKFDVIYLDPARRDSLKNKKFLLEDLSPNLLEIQEELHKISHKIIVKLSPLIDISYLVSVLKNISEIQIIAVRNEVKELLVLMETDFDGDVTIKCVNLKSDEPVFTFKFNEEKAAISAFSEPLKYIYIPNNAVLKSGAFNGIAQYFGLKKLHPNTHLYTSDEKLGQFPGRILEMATISSAMLKKGEKYNIISKNHPLTPDQIKKKFKLSDGGNHYLIFTQALNSKVILRTVASSL